MSQRHRLEYLAALGAVVLSGCFLSAPEDACVPGQILVQGGEGWRCETPDEPPTRDCPRDHELLQVEHEWVCVLLPIDVLSPLGASADQKRAVRFILRVLLDSGNVDEIVHRFRHDDLLIGRSLEYLEQLPAALSVVKWGGVDGRFTDEETCIDYIEQLAGPLLYAFRRAPGGAAAFVDAYQIRYVDDLDVEELKNLSPMACLVACADTSDCLSASGFVSSYSTEAQ